MIQKKRCLCSTSYNKGFLSFSYFFFIFTWLLCFWKCWIFAHCMVTMGVNVGVNLTPTSCNNVCTVFPIHIYVTLFFYPKWQIFTKCHEETNRYFKQLENQLWVKLTPKTTEGIVLWGNLLFMTNSNSAACLSVSCHCHFVCALKASAKDKFLLFDRILGNKSYFGSYSKYRVLHVIADKDFQ